MKNIKKNFLSLPIEFIKKTEKKIDDSDKKYLMGIDGGATKTRVCITDFTGKIVCNGIAGSSNQESVGFEQAVKSLYDAIDNAFSHSNVSINYQDIHTAVFSVAGIATEEHQHRFQNTFTHTMPDTQCYFENDIIAAWASGTFCKPGIAIISGTGSNAIGINADGKAWQTGGWGHILSDEGSGYMIGLNGFRMALQYYDGRIEKTCLIEDVFSYLEISHIEQLLELFYQKTLSNDSVAAFAEYVSNAARSGDLVAKKIFFDAGMEISQLAVAIIKKLNFYHESFPIALRGSVFKSYDLLKESIETVLDIAPHATIISDNKQMLSPVEGAILLASRAAGIWDNFDIS